MIRGIFYLLFFFFFLDTNGEARKYESHFLIFFGPRFKKNLQPQLFVFRTLCLAKTMGLQSKRFGHIHYMSRP